MATWAVYINDREMTPYNLDKVKITEFKEEYMRVHKKISSPLYFINSPIDDKYDYDYIIGLSFDDKHTVRITKNGVTKYTGEFNKTAIKVSRDDIGERMVSLTPDAIDEYTVIHEGEDIEVNAIDGLERTYIKGNRETYIFYYSGLFLLDESDWPSDHTKIWDDTRNASDYKHYMVFAQERIIGDSDSNFSDLGFVVVDDLGSGLSLWGREPVGITLPTDFEIYTLAHNKDIHYSVLTQQDLYGETHYYYYSGGEFPLSGRMWLPNLKESDEWTVVSETKINLYATEGDTEIKSYTDYVAIKNNILLSPNIITENYPCYELKQVLNKVIKLAAPSFIGEVKSNELFYDNLYLIDKSDFKRPKSSELATVSNTTFKKLIEDIKTLIKGTWYIDESGDLRIEKISDRVLGDGADISSYITSKDDYEYINDEIPNRIIFSPTEAWSEDFTQKEIVYGNIPVLQGVKEQKQEISFSTLTTDFDGANQHLDQLSDDGFILIETSTIYSPNGDINIVRRDTGKYTNETQIQNANLSIANILYNYYRHEAYKQTFTMNGVETEALSLKKLKVQPAVVAILPQEPDIENSITTMEGEGEIETIEESCTDENLYTMRILYPH